MRTYLLTIIFTTGVFPFSSAVAAVQRKAEYTSTELRQLLAEENARIRSFYVVYETVPTDGPSRPSGSYMRRTIAAYAPSSLFHSGAKGSGLYAPKDDPFQQCLRLSGSTVTINRPQNRSFFTIHLNASDPLPGSLPGEFLFSALGWWPLDSREPEPYPGAAVVFPSIARSPVYVLRPFQERVNGRWCHVLERPARDRLWIDVQHGCALMAREIVSPANLQRIEAFGQHEVAPHVWAPTRFESRVYEGPSTQRRLARTTQFIVKELTVNAPPPKDLFQFEPKLGAIEWVDGKFSQVTPGGLDHLEQLTTLVREHLHNSRRAQESLSAPGWSFILSVNIVSMLSVGCAVLFCRARRHRISHDDILP